MNDSINILLVEDNPADARLVQETLLETAGGQPSRSRFRLTVADCLSAGQDLLTQGNVDVILLDLSLPDSDGLDTLLNISAQAPTLPIIVMTGLDDESVTMGALQAGAQDYLIKGELDSNLLVRAIRYAIERKKAELALREHEKQLQQLNQTLEQRVKEQTAEVRRLASDLTLAEQHERYRIAHILHDDLQQRLYAIQMQLAFLNGGLEIENPAIRKDVAELAEQLEGALALTRNLSIDLSPPVLHEEGLAQAINWLATQMYEQHGLKVELQAEESFALSNPELQVLLFTFVRELLFNVIKHAGVNQAVVSLQRSNTDLRIEVRDEGKGFNRTVSGGYDISPATEAASQKRTFGLPTLRHRLGLFGGHMAILSEPGTGTQVSLTIPVYEKELNREESSGR